MTLATDERAAICDELDRVGPARPTLCDGWTTRDLVAHLLVRERQPWAVAGGAVPALAPLTDRAMAAYADRPWSEVVGQLRAGAPPWSPYRIGKVDELANGLEFFVHHEDVRRGEPGWEPRPADPGRDALLWAALPQLGRLMYLRSKVAVAFRRPAGAQLVVRTGPGLVTVVGEPGEIVLHAFGRDAARVELEGDAADLAVYAGRRRGF